MNKVKCYLYTILQYFSYLINTMSTTYKRTLVTSALPYANGPVAANEAFSGGMFGGAF